MRINSYDLSGSLFLLDSNALMHEHFRSFIRNDLVLAVKEYREKSGQEYYVYIPKTVKEELESLRERPQSANIGKRTDALRGYATMEELVEKGYGRYAKSDFTGAAGRFNDVAILTMLMELRRHSHIAVLTNDRNFCTDLLTLNTFKSVKSSKQIRAFYVGNKTGKLSEWTIDPTHREAVRFPNEFDREVRA